MTHPIAPPPELVQQWYDDAREASVITSELANVIVTRAAQWGSDQELEACIDWISVWHGLEHPELLIELLRAARRPKPPSLKEQAKQALETLNQTWTTPKELDAVITIRRALEQLDD